MDLRGAFDYETPPTGEMVMVNFVCLKFMLCRHAFQNKFSRKKNLTSYYFLNFKNYNTQIYGYILQGSVGEAAHMDPTKPTNFSNPMYDSLPGKKICIL